MNGIHRKIISEHWKDYLKAVIFAFVSRITISTNSMTAFEPASTSNQIVHEPLN